MEEFDSLSSEVVCKENATIHGMVEYSYIVNAYMRNDNFIMSYITCAYHKDL